MKKTVINFIFTVILISLTQPAAGQAAKKDYPITPVPFTAVKIADGFWAPRMETNRAVTIPAIFRKC
jgi:hypothetical protein